MTRERQARPLGRDDGKATALASQLGHGRIPALPSSAVTVCETDFPLARIPQDRDFALAVITEIEGSAYRPLGAAMVIDARGQSWGSLSSGCLERDVVLRAQATIASNQPRVLRYGRGSPILDIELPCGGGLEIRIVPNPDRALLARARQALCARQAARISLGANGRMAEAGTGGMELTILPQIRFLIFGKGPEATCFAELVRQAGYPAELFAPNPETLAAAGFGQPLIGTGWPAGLHTDSRSAVTLFFHDHEQEPALLQAALAGPAFYIGAQGSRRVHRERCKTLAARGVPQERVESLASPFGLIPSTRDARTLAVSVLAHVLDRARLAGQSTP